RVEVRPVTAGELCGLYARALRRGGDEPAYDTRWEPPEAPAGTGPGRDRPQGVLAHLTDAVVKEGGYPDDPGRPHHRRYVRIDGNGQTTYQTVLAMADMPHHFVYPGGAGEWLFHADQVGFPVDWAVRVRATTSPPSPRCGASPAAWSARSTSTTASSPGPPRSWPPPSRPSTRSGPPSAPTPPSPSCRWRFPCRWPPTTSRTSRTRRRRS